jgi:hypothetical protein
MANTMLILAAESTSHESGGANPWLVGGTALAILLVTLIAVVAFGGGREHS